jgi:signal transduction histidine kinase
MAIHLVLAIAFAETLILAAVLRVWAQQVAGVRWLTVFLLGVATWIAGNELPNWFGPGVMPFAFDLLATVPLTSAAFLHFCWVFCRVPPVRRWRLPAAYGGAAAATLLSWLVTPGTFVHYQPFTGVEWVVVPNAVGWTTSLVWALFAAAGINVLARSFFQSRDPQEKRQIAAVAVSCGWGLMCMSGYAFAALDIPMYPWQVLAFPAYPLILVYGILRYRVFVANAWARRALAWTLLLGLGLLAVPLSLMLPVDSRWASGLLVAAICLVLNGPVRRIAERIVYPGAAISAADLAEWRKVLVTADTPARLETLAAQLLSARIKLEVEVHVGADDAPDSPVPALVCGAGLAGWETQLRGWESAPPGPRRLAELFAGVLAEAAAHVQQAGLAEQRERERQLQARLAELGALAASVAHDLRNPLNIIAMAVATAPQETRREVAGQVDRISRLAEDLLDYARPWGIRPIELDAAGQVRAMARRSSGVELGAGLDEALPIKADPMRFDQALGNLLSNARAATGATRVQVDAERGPGEVYLHICDDGAGVPADLRERVFEPFVSRSAGGTGLGLAIVARIMAAHGGSVRLNDRPPWNTCFTLIFPAAR